MDEICEKIQQAHEAMATLKKKLQRHVSTATWMKQRTRHLIKIKLNQISSLCKMEKSLRKLLTSTTKVLGWRTERRTLLFWRLLLVCIPSSPFEQRNIMDCSCLEGMFVTLPSFTIGKFKWTCKSSSGGWSKYKYKRDANGCVLLWVDIE